MFILLFYVSPNLHPTSHPPLPGLQCTYILHYYSPPDECVLPKKLFMTPHQQTVVIFWGDCFHATLGSFRVLLFAIWLIEKVSKNRNRYCNYSFCVKRRKMDNKKKGFSRFLPAYIYIYIWASHQMGCHGARRCLHFFLMYSRRHDANFRSTYRYRQYLPTVCRAPLPTPPALRNYHNHMLLREHCIFVRMPFLLAYAKNPCARTQTAQIKRVREKEDTVCDYGALYIYILFF